MKPYIARKLVEFAASLLGPAPPGRLVRAGVTAPPDLFFFWFVLMICSGTFSVCYDLRGSVEEGI